MRNPLQSIFLSLLLGAPSLAKAGEITGEAIFNKQNEQVGKIEKNIEEADAAAEANLKKAKIQCLRARVSARQRAVVALTLEEDSLKRTGSASAIVDVANAKKRWKERLEAARQALVAETGADENPTEGEDPGVAVPAKPAPPPAKMGASETAPEHPVAAETPEAEKPAAEPATYIAPQEVPKLMLGKWKWMENNKVRGYFLLSSTGQMKVYKAFKANGSPELQGGVWRVSSAGEVELISDVDNGKDILRVMMTDEHKAAGNHWVRNTPGAPYRKGKDMEFQREGK